MHFVIMYGQKDKKKILHRKLSHNNYFIIFRKGLERIQIKLKKI